MLSFFEYISDIILHPCEYHAAVNIQTRIKKAGKYNEENAREFANQVWASINAPTIEDLDTAREMLLQNLQPADKSYLNTN